MAGGFLSYRPGTGYVDVRMDSQGNRKYFDAMVPEKTDVEKREANCQVHSHLVPRKDVMHNQGAMWESTCPLDWTGESDRRTYYDGHGIGSGVQELGTFAGDPKVRLGFGH